MYATWLSFSSAILKSTTVAFTTPLMKSGALAFNVTKESVVCKSVVHVVWLTIASVIAKNKIGHATERIVVPTQSCQPGELTSRQYGFSEWQTLYGEVQGLARSLEA